MWKGQGVPGPGHSCQHVREIIMGLEVPFASYVVAVVTSKTHSFHGGGDGVGSHVIQPTVTEHRMQVVMFET